MTSGDFIRKVTRWAAHTLYAASAVFLTCFAAWAAGITVPSGSSLEVANNELNVAGDMEIYGTLSTTTGTIALDGNWTTWGVGSYQAGTGTVKFNAANPGTQIIRPGTETDDGFYHLIHEGTGTVSLQANPADVNGNFTNSAGTFNANAIAMYVAGNWNNAATFQHGNGSVILDGDNQAITGTSTFYNLSKELAVAVSRQLTFPNTVTQTVVNNLTLRGFNAGNLLVLRSDVNNTAAGLTLQNTGTQSIQYVDVKDNNASGGLMLIARSSPDHSDQPTWNNTNWWFGGVTIKWDGSQDDRWDNPYNWNLGLVPGVGDTAIVRSVDEDNGNAPIANQPRLETNVQVGTLEIRTGASLTTDQHNLTIDSTFTLAGNLILDGNETVAVTTTFNNTGTVTYYGMQNGQVNANITRNITLGGAFVTSFYNLAINEQNIAAQRDTFLTDAVLTVTNDLNVIEGTLQPAAAVNVTNNVTVSGGLFDLSTNGITLTPLQTLTVSGGELDAETGDIDAVNVAITGGELSAPGAGHSFTVSGNWSHTAGTFTPNAGAVIFDLTSAGAATNQQISGSTDFYDFVKAVPGGTAQTHTLTFESGSLQRVSHQLTLTGFDLPLNRLFIRSSGVGQANLRLLPGAGQTIRNVDVNNNNANGGLLLVARGSSQDSLNNNNWDFDGISLKWDGSESTAWTDPFNWDVGMVPADGDTVIIRSINEDAGGAVITNQPVLSGAVSVANLTLREVDTALYLNGNDLSIVDVLTPPGVLVNNGTIHLYGSEDLVIEEMDTDSGTFQFEGDNTGDSFTITQGTRPGAFFNLSVDDGHATPNTFLIDEDLFIYGTLSVSGGTLDVANYTVDVDGSFYQDAGTFLAPVAGETFTIGGDFTHPGGTFTAGNGTVTFDRTSALGLTTQTITGTTTFYDFRKVVPGGATQVHELAFGNTGVQTFSNSVTMTGLAANPLVIKSTSVDPDAGIRDAAIQLSSGGSQSISYVDVADSNASGVNVLTLVGRNSADHEVGFNNTNWSFGNATLTWTGLASTNWEDPDNWDLGLAPVNGDNINIPGYDGAGDPILNQPQLTAASGNVSLVDLTIYSGATLTLNGYDLTSTGTFSNEGNIIARGDETILIATPDTNSGTFTYLGDNSGSLNLNLFDPGHTEIQYFNLTLSDAGAVDTFVTQADTAIYGMLTVSGGLLNAGAHDLDVDDDVAIHGTGSLTAPGAGQTFTVGGSWELADAGVFTHNNGKVDFDGTGVALITGNTTFYDLEATTNVAKTLRFEAGSNQTVVNDLALSGDQANRLVLESDTEGTKWTITVNSGTKTATNVDVKDSIATVAGASPFIVAFNSVDREASGVSTNSGWRFVTLKILFPETDSTVGPEPVIIGQGVENGFVEIYALPGHVNSGNVGQVLVAVGECDSRGYFRVPYGVNQQTDATGIAAPLAPGLFSLVAVYDGFYGQYNHITVVPAPTTLQVPVITGPDPAQPVMTSRPTMTGNATPNAAIYIIANDIGGNLPLTMEDDPAYAGTGTVNGDGTFSVRLTTSLPRGANYISAVVNGVSSPLMTYEVYDLNGTVFDSSTNRAVAGARVWMYRADGTPATIGTAGTDDLTEDNTNPYVTTANGQFRFRTNRDDDYYLRVEGSGFVFPTTLTNSQLPSGRSVVNGSRGEVFSTSDLVAQMDLPMDGTPTLYRVEKSANKKEAKVGDVVTYSVTIENLSDNILQDGILHDIIPPGFKYMDNRVLLNNVPIANPTGNRPLAFQTGSFAAKEKKTLRYQLVVGSGVAPGNYENAAYMRYQTGIVLSNRATETVKVMMDPLFDLGTVFGKVYYDWNDNGRQDAPDFIYEDRMEVIEGPVGNVRIVMEDGTTVVTDKNGQFHIPKLLPGRHLLRIDERTLPPNSYVTTSKVQVIDITPGSILKLNFGINVDNNAIVSDDVKFFQTKVLIDQNASAPVPRLNVDVFNPEILFYNNAILEQPEFRMFLNYAPFIQNWKLDIVDKDTKKLVRSFSGNADAIRNPIYWDGRDGAGRYIRPERHYSYYLKVEDGKGNWDETSEKELTLRVLTDQEWEARNLKKSEEQLAEEMKALARRKKEWALAQAKADSTKARTIPVQGETLRIDPQETDVRQVRVLRDGQLYADIPVPQRHALTALELAQNTVQHDEPFEIILPNGDYELEIVSAEGNVSESTVEAISSVPADPKPDMSKAAARIAEGGGVVTEGKEEDKAETGKVAQYRKPLRVGEDYLMFVAMGDGKVGYNMNRGNIEPVQSNDRYRKGFYTEGKMAYYLKGKIKGKYLVTSSFDSERKQKEMFRDIQEDEYYPVYGDSSTINYDATNTQGPLFLLVEWDKSKAIWGNYAVDFNDTEFSKFTRTLYGGQIDYTSVASTPLGDPRTKVAVFHAEVRQRSAHAEFVGTGGSLYYLKHRDVVPGSDKIRIEVRDQVTGQVRSTKTVQEGVDYNIDYSEGRILFWQPVAMSADSGSIISNNLLAGDPVYVVSDYEYFVKDKMTESTQGARVAQAVTDNVVVGGTYVSETQTGGEYELMGQDVTVRLSKDSTIKAEYAESTAQDSPAYVSTDGGITFTQVNSTGDVKGRAYGITQDARLFDRIGLASYYKWIDAGFSTSGTTSQQGKELKGINMTFDLTPVTRLTAAYDIQKLIEQGNIQTQMQVGAQETRTTAIQLVHEARRLRLTYEFQQQEVRDKSQKFDTVQEQSATAAIQAEYALNPRTDILLKHQSELLKVNTQTTTVGLRRRLTDRLTGTIEQSFSSDGTTTTKGGLTANVTDRIAVTTEYGVSKGKDGRVSETTTSIKADSQIGKALTVSTELAATQGAAGTSQQTATVSTKGQLTEKTAVETALGVTQTPQGQRSTLAMLGSTTIDNATLRAGAETGTDEAGVGKNALTFDADRTETDGRHTTSGVKVQETAADGKQTVLTMGQSGQFGLNSQLSAERSFAFGEKGQDKADTYTLSKVKDGRKTETSYARKFSDKQAERSSSNIFGLTGDINDKWAADVSFEQGNVQNTDGSKTDRLAISGGVGYLEKDPETGTEIFKSSTKAEARLDKGSTDKTQYVFMESFEGKVNEEFSLVGKFEWSETMNKDAAKVEAKYKEILLGTAYRPIANDRLNLFARYTYKDNLGPQGQTSAAVTDVTQTKMHVLTAEGAYDLTEDWQIVERLAYRIMEEKVVGFEFSKTHTWLLVNRLNYRLGKDWKIGAEYRLLAQREASDKKQGFLVEATRSVNDNLEMGIGFNFTDFMDDLTKLDYTSAGPFIRMTGKLYDRTPEEKARAKAKWLERRVNYYAWKMINAEMKRKDSPVMQELNQMYAAARELAEKKQYSQARQMYKNIVQGTQMMFEEAAQYIRKHISFEEKLYTAYQRALEYYDRGDYWMAKKIWEKIVEEASKAVIE